MFRVIVPEGEIACEAYEMTDHGIELYDGDGEFLGFAPYSSVSVLVDESVYSPGEGEPSVY
jgi:hypothetical protein